MDKLTGFCDVNKEQLNGKFFVWKLGYIGGEKDEKINHITILVGTDISQYPAKEGFQHACGKGCMMKALDELTDSMFGMKEVKE
jgi:hypothetical protein